MTPLEYYDKWVNELILQRIARIKQIELFRKIRVIRGEVLLYILPSRLNNVS